MTEHLPSDEISPHDGTGAETPAVTVPADWDPRDPSVSADPVAAYDELRSRCPVARGVSGAWTFFSHRDVKAAALDDETFSNGVSRHLQVPNGLDGEEHDLFRPLIDRYLTAERVAALAPEVQEVAEDLVAELAVPGAIDAVEIGSAFAVRAQSAWLGWPDDLEEELLAWMEANRSATRSADRSRTAGVAEWFDGIISTLTGVRRAMGAAAPDDVTTELIHDRSIGRELTDREIVSILRNWTGGDLGSMALCTGVVLTHLADHPQLQERMRSGISQREFDAILDEILRLDDPFVANRRLVTSAATVGGRDLIAGDRVFLNWTSANRDPDVFGDPDEFDPAGHALHNLVYGIGRHVCPGRGLATMELRVLTRAVLEATTAIDPDPDRPREREQAPVGGYSVAPLRLR